ncbi:MAG: DUF4143 domain-containing protein [Oligoflexia bacterium]|nr:DUF4143 domain-containing protein [Oligoflexia bacterium]
MELARILQLKPLLAKNSFFLFGPRGTGKSSLIRDQLSEQAVVIDLLRQADFARLAENPELLEPIILGKNPRPAEIVIDEVQKLPALLDEVHRLIEERRWRFLLTGSSARKLRRGHANLLGGRAWVAELRPFVWKELAPHGQWRLDDILHRGTLPSLFFAEDSREALDAYLRTYLTIEVQAEGLTRNIPRFQRFLRTAALSVGQLVNYAAIGSDAGIPETTVKSHFEILSDTLLGFELEPFLGSKKRKAIRTAKFYFFDNGILHGLLGTETLTQDTDLYGRSLEQYLINEVAAYNSYARKKKELFFWRDKSGYEVDLLVEGELAVEIKATRRAAERDLRGLVEFQKEKCVSRSVLVSRDPVPRKIGSTEFLPVELFLERLWGGDFF